MDRRKFLAAFATAVMATASKAYIRMGELLLRAEPGVGLTVILPTNRL